MSSVWTSQSLNRTRSDSPTANPCRRKYDLSIEEKRVKGIEPSCPAWEAGVLPLNYTREGRIGIVDFRIQICKGQTHCQEMTSSELVNFLSPALPSAKSLPKDHAITPCRIGSAPAPFVP